MVTEPFLAWDHPTAPWIAKLNWADGHLRRLKEEIEDFERRAYEVLQEASSERLTITLRFRLHEPIPIRFSLMIGDVVHSLRSALDTLAYEFARRKIGGDLPNNLAGLPTFPICTAPKDYDTFFGKRRDVFGQKEETALRAVAPGWRYDPLAIEGERPWTFQDEAIADLLWRLNRLWNIDKHRRLHLAVWWPELTWWTSDDATSYDWRPGSPPFEDGTIVGELIATDPDTPPPMQIKTDFVLRLQEPHFGAQSLLNELQRMHDYISKWVIPVAWQVYLGRALDPLAKTQAALDVARNYPETRLDD